MALLRELTRTRVSLPDGEPSDADRAKIKTQIKATLERLLDDDAFLTLLAEESLAEQKPSKGRQSGRAYGLLELRRVLFRSASLWGASAPRAPPRQ